MDPVVSKWFEVWESGLIDDLPIRDDFTHTSPFGKIVGKSNYLELVKKNLDKFLGYRFEIHDALQDGERSCIRYTAIQSNFKLDVSEWHFTEGGLIKEIIAYYHIGEIREERKLDTI